MPQHYENRDARVLQIAQAALTLMVESGLRRLTSRAIAQEVGITDGTVFRHFRNKEEIILAAMELLERRMFGDGFPEHSDPLQRLEAFFRARAEFLGNKNGLGRLMFSDHFIHAAGEAGRNKLRLWRDKNMGFVTGCLRELEVDGRLCPGQSAAEAAMLVQGTLLTFSFQRLLEDEGTPALAERVDAGWLSLATALGSGRRLR